MQGGHKGQPTFIAPLQLLFHAPADSEAEAAAALIVQLTHKMPLQVLIPKMYLNPRAFPRSHPVLKSLSIVTILGRSLQLTEEGMQLPENQQNDQG